ncbi:hypothetical protein [Luteococcus peritonei]|uniref:NAD(P)/FAD-dependent oxidoreductase n=1 Tax=Luteococcus peritonei TaxID=88874 RepID=A0ABW4RQN6_9ACTN
MSETYLPGRVRVHGASLAGMAAAARLAKAGHEVVLDAAGLPDGGHWAARSHLGVAVDELPQTFLLPAAWRDLFKKSGRALDAELARHRLDLVAAPDQLHRFADGRELSLPTERGGQFHAVALAFGSEAATRWTALLDELDELWQHLRMAGLERPVGPDTFDRTTRAQLMAERSVDELADRAGDPHLACIVRSQAALGGAAPGRNPALLAVRLAVLRRFGSWQLVDLSAEQPAPVRASRLLELLSERLTLRGVERVGQPTPLLGTGTPDLSRLGGSGPAEADAELEALPVLPEGFLGRRLGRPALAPTVAHRIVEEATATPGIVEVVDHTAGTPVVTWRRPLGDGRVVETVHDHNRPRPDLAWGLAPNSWRAWQQRPRLGGEGHWHASAASHAGGEPWAELLSGALAVYEIHEYLTDTDIRPTNKNPPQLPRRRRPTAAARVAG